MSPLTTCLLGLTLAAADGPPQTTTGGPASGAAQANPFLPIIGTAAGTGERGFGGDGGPADKALLDNPFDVTFDRDGNLFFSDTNNHRIRRVDARTRVVTTVAGGGTKGFGGDGGPAIRAEMDEPYGVEVDPQGDVFFVDRLNRRVRKVDGRTGIITTVAGDGSKKGSGDGGPATNAGLAEPNGIALDKAGNLLIADVADHRIRKVDARTGIISTFAGTGKGAHSGDGGPADEASLFGARAVAVGADGTVYIIERQGNTLRAVDPATGTIQTLAGTGKKGYSGDGGPADKATFDGPKELDVDAAGNVLIVDTENHAIRRYDAATRTIATVAGSSKRGGSGDGGPATSAQLDRPHGVALAPDGTITIGDTGNHRIRRTTWMGSRVPAVR